MQVEQQLNQGLCPCPRFWIDDVFQLTDEFADALDLALEIFVIRPNIFRRDGPSPSPLPAGET
jgi:hypothetical protein